MSLTRLDNLYSSKTGKYLYVSPDDFNATDTLDNRGNSPNRPFKTIQRAFLEVSRFSYQPGANNDRFDQFSIMLMPGDHYIDNRPGLVNYSVGTTSSALNRYADAGNLIESNKLFLAYEAYALMLQNNPGFVTPTGNVIDCIDDVVDILDAIIYNVKFGGNNQVFDAALLYQNNPALIASELSESIEVYNNLNTLVNLVITNAPITSVVDAPGGVPLTDLQITSAYTQVFDPTISTGPSEFDVDGPNIPYGQAETCADVQSTINTLFSVLLEGINETLDFADRTEPETLGEIPVFGFDQINGEWDDNSIIDLSNPNNIYWKFNASTGGAIVPRGCSLVGYDLRRTIVRPLYVPDPADSNQERTSIFNLTGGCYLWQFTIKDGDLTSNSPLFDPTDNVGKVYYQKGNISTYAIPDYSHHKITIMEYAENFELDAYYEKVGIAFSEYQPTIDEEGEFDALVQENRIVGPLSDTRSIEIIKPIDTNLGQPNQKLVLEVTTKIDHGYFKDQFVAILNTGLDEETNGTFKVASIDPTNPKKFTYEIPGKVSAGLGLTNNQQYRVGSGLSNNAVTQAEIDSVESASPYVFNCSIRSTWGMCGMWANGAKATGFRSMVVAQYTGVSLQKDDRAFIRYDEFTNTWNQASLTDAFATVPYHTKGDAYWKDDWRNFHIRASEDSFIQCVSVFAVGFFDHFLMESGGDMSITNSNSNFGNTSLHSIGHKGYSFNQDKGGYITDIIPPQEIVGGYAANPNDPSLNSERIPYYPLDIVTSNDPNNKTRLYLGADSVYDPALRPAATLNGYRIGARPDEKLFIKLEPRDNSNDTIFSATLTPNSIETYQVGVDFLNPTGITINQKAQDASNLINVNREFIQDEAYGYITTKYPDLLTNGSITIETCRRDIGYYVDAIVQDLRLGGNINSVQAAEAYFVGGQLTYIVNERDETIDALGVVEDLCIAAMRNFDYLLTGCATTLNSDVISVPSTTGLVVGMKVTSYSSYNPGNGTVPTGSPTATIPTDSYVVEIIDDTTIRIGEKGQYIFGTEQFDPSPTDKLATQTITASGPDTGAFLYFTLRDETIVPVVGDNVVRDGIFSDVRTSYDDTVTQDIVDVSAGETECSDIASTISGLFIDIATILSSPFGQDGVDRIEPDTDFSALSKRATLFRVSGNNPHGMETGTAVRLIPKAAPGEDPDPRLIRLPKGFDTNTKYYVIAPGRNTAPENYSGTTAFDGTDQTVFLLASTPENARAGNYIYSPETDAIDPNVIIEVNKYIIDDKYDLHKYESTIQSGNIRTNLANHFDIPAIGVEPQKIFFRQIDNDTPLPNQTVFAGGSFVTQGISQQQEYFVRYVSNNQFRIFTTFNDAVNDVNSVLLTESAPGAEFIIYSNKRFSPMRFDPEPISNGVTTSTTGQWYLQCEDNSADPTDILGRITEPNDSTYFGSSPAETRSTDGYFERIIDERVKEDRVYKLRYVIPSYLETVRDPLNGFVIKVRTDGKRRLRPQRIILKPVDGNYQANQPETWTSSSIATFVNNGGFDTSGQFVNPNEKLGRSSDLYGQNNVEPVYDPYINPKIVETNGSKTSFSIQSAKVINQEVEVGSNYNYLEVIAFDHSLENQALKNERFVIVEVDSPDGQPFIANNVISEPSNLIQWSGGSSGTGYLHGFFKTADLALTPKSTNGAKYYLIIKNIIDGKIEFDKFTPTTFFQGGTTVGTSLSQADLLSKPDSIGSPNGGSKSSKEDYLYSFKGSNVYTLVPGDTITDDAGNDFYIDTIEDVGELDDTFYIFDIQEIKERIPGQQDGIYYLICLKGDVSPFPTGPGVGNNFKNFKFSQPISYLYPQDYKNDPVWYQQIDADFNDPPATNSAADNYTHGLVTVNDARYSETKEVVNFLIETPALEEYTYENDIQAGIDARIRAQEGNAVAGAEDRKIPIKGTNDYPTDSRFYVELRRPSIARSGNHTFEYLGFGPGNYSTGFPLRQEVILTDAQDFYAQSKREDGGIVFYTGLNSNGDLYIGNKKVNAITGEETFLESAQLIGSQDPDDDVGDTLVTTFESPVTFNNKISVNGPSTFTEPVTIQVDPETTVDPVVSLRIQSLVDSLDLGEDPTLDRSSFARRVDGDITLSKNKINSAIFALNPRGNTNFPGQNYSIRTHVVELDNSLQPSNITPNQSTSLYDSNSITRVSSNRLFDTQPVLYGNSANTPNPGDILFKGTELNFSGSLGWAYANRFIEIPASAIQTVATPKLDQIGQIQVGLGVGPGIQGLNLIRLIWSSINGSPITNETLRQTYGLTPQSLIRISGLTGDLTDDANGIFEINQDTYSNVNTFLDIVVGRFITDYDIVAPWTNYPLAEVFISNSEWKEVGVIGAEAIRTETSVLGDYKLGINTVSRTPHSAYANGFVDDTTVPRANLDLVGNAFISGTTDARDALGVVFSLYKDEADPALRTTRYTEYAFLVGGEEDTPEDLASFRISTGHGTQVERETKDGRVGINLTNDQLNGTADGQIYNRAFAVYGGATVSGNVRFERNLELNGAAQDEYDGTYGTASLTSRASTFNFIDTATNNNVTTLNMGGQVTTANIFNDTTDAQVVNIGTSSLSTTFNLHTSSENSVINLGVVDNTAGFESIITVGGAIETPNASEFLIRNFRTILAGKMVLRGGASDTGTVGLIEGEGIDSVVMFPEGVTTFSLAERATVFNLGATAGKTTIKNNLIVNGTATVKSDITLEGGLRNSSISIERNVFGALDIVTLERSSNVARITLTQAQTVLSSGQQIEVFSSNESFNTAIPETVTVVNSTTLEYANVGPDLAPFAATGTVRTLSGTGEPFGFLQPIGNEVNNLNVDFYQRIEKIAPAREITTISGTTKLNINFNYLSEGDPIIFTKLGNLTGTIDGAPVDQITTYYVATADGAGITVTNAPGGTEIALFTYTDPGQLNAGGAEVILAFTKIDTQGDVPWGGPAFDNGDGSYRLFINNPVGLALGEYILVGNEVVFAVSEPSAVQPYYIDVQRGIDGSPVMEHPDDTQIFLLSRTEDTTFIFPNTISQNDTVLNVGEFSTTVSGGDLLRLNGGTATEEWVRVLSIGSDNAQKLIVNNGDFGDAINPKDPLEVFKVNSVDGNTRVLGDLQIGYDTFQFTIPDNDFANSQAAADAFGIDSSVATGNTITTTGGGNLRVHNSIELSGNASWDEGTPATYPARQYFLITNGQFPRFFVESKTGDTSIFGSGSLRIYNDEFFSSGGWDKSKISTAELLKFEVDGSTGNTTVAGTLRVGDDLNIGTLLDSNAAEGPVNPYTSRFNVDAQTGNSIIGDPTTTGTGASLSVYADFTATPSDAPRFSVNNLGINNSKPFNINQDGSIDAFGQDKFYNSNGGRKTVFISSQGNTDATAEFVDPNVTYLVRPTSDLIIKLPDTPTTGDIIRFVDIGGVLNFGINLVIRAQGANIQNESGGSSLGGLSSAYSGGGEMVVNTPNAGFGLIYVGSLDGNGIAIPGANQGWFLVEI